MKAAGSAPNSRSRGGRRHRGAQEGGGTSKGRWWHLLGPRRHDVLPALGVVAIVDFAWAGSGIRRVVSPRRIGMGLIVALVLAARFLKVPPISRAFAYESQVIEARAAASRAGTSFVFG